MEILKPKKEKFPQVLSAKKGRQSPLRKKQLLKRKPDFFYPLFSAAAIWRLFYFQLNLLVSLLFQKTFMPGNMIEIRLFKKITSKIATASFILFILGNSKFRNNKLIVNILQRCPIYEATQIRALNKQGNKPNFLF